MNKNLLDFYKQVHTLWHWFNKQVNGMGTEMRLTGFPNTSLGNVIVNLIVNTNLIKQLGPKLTMFIVLGDDGLMACNTIVDTKQQKQRTKNMYNMDSTISISRTHGIFLKRIIFNSIDG